MKVAVDLVVLAVGHGELQALLVRRAGAPFVGYAALPGGFVNDGEDPCAAARRELREETGIRPRGHLDQLKTYGAPNRDPRGHVISIAYLVLLPDLPTPHAGSDAAGAYWQPVNTTPSLAFDHDGVLRDSLDYVRRRVAYTPLATALCRPEFTVPELRGIYEAVWGIALDPRNFHRKALNAEGFIRATGTRRLGGGRPGQLYTRGGADILHPPLLRPKERAPIPADRSNALTRELAEDSCDLSRWQGD